MSYRKRRRRRLILIGLGVLGVGLAVVLWWGYERVTAFSHLTLAGRVSATAAVQSLEKRDPATAVTLLAASRHRFSDARNLLGPAWLRGVPGLGRQLDAADQLCTIGIEASGAGLEMARLLDESAEAPTDSRLNRLLARAPARLDAALTSLVALSDVTDALRPDGLVPPLADAVNSLRDVAGRMGPLANRSRPLLGLERTLFSRQHRFLVLTQDNAELRPTGGSIETFSLVSFGPDGFELTRSADVATLPVDRLRLADPAARKAGLGDLGFRDANWWMDFPTSATRLEQLWRGLGQAEVDGIIAVDVPMIQSLLGVYGSVRVPQASAPLTSDNLIEQLTSIAARDAHGDAGPQRKRAVLAVTEELVRRATNLTDDQVLPTIDAFSRGADEKHLQMFLLDPGAQADLVAMGWAGSMTPPDGTTDLLAVNNGSVAPGRANLRVSKTLDYRVELAADGTADTLLTLGYRKAPLKLKGVPEPELRDYLRLHRLPGATLVRKPSSAFAAVKDPTGLATVGRSFRLRLGSSREVVRWTVPDALVAEGTVWRYRLLVAKQADLADTRASISVTAPPGWRLDRADARFRATGAAISTTPAGPGVTATTPLTQDVVLDVTLVEP